MGKAHRGRERCIAANSACRPDDAFRLGILGGGRQKELIEFRQTYAEVAAGNKRMMKQQQQAEGLSEVTATPRPPYFVP